MFNMLNRVGARSRAASLATPILPIHHVHHPNNSGRKPSDASVGSPPGSPLRISSSSDASSPPPTPQQQQQQLPQAPGLGRSRANSHGHRARFAVISPSLADIFEQLRSADEKEIEAAGKTLLNVTTSATHARRRKLVEHEGFPRVVKLLTEGSSRAKILATAIVSNLASTSDEIRELLVGAGPGPGGVVKALLANVASDHHCIQQVSMQAICNLTAGSGRTALYEAGAVPKIIEAMRRGSDECRPHAVGALNNLSSLSAGAKNDIYDAGAVPLLVEVLERCEHAETRERAAYTLWNLSSEPHIRAHLFRIGAAQHVVRQLTCPEHTRSMTPPKSPDRKSAPSPAAAASGVDRECGGGRVDEVGEVGGAAGGGVGVVRGQVAAAKGRRRSASVVV